MAFETDPAKCVAHNDHVYDTTLTTQDQNYCYWRETPFQGHFHRFGGLYQVLVWFHVACGILLNTVSMCMWGWDLSTALYRNCVCCASKNCSCQCPRSFLCSRGRCRVQCCSAQRTLEGAILAKARNARNDAQRCERCRSEMPLSEMGETVPMGCRSASACLCCKHPGRMQRFYVAIWVLHLTVALTLAYTRMLTQGPNPCVFELGGDTASVPFQ